MSTQCGSRKIDHVDTHKVISGGKAREGVLVACHDRLVQQRGVYQRGKTAYMTYLLRFKILYHDHEKIGLLYGSNSS